MSSNDGLTKNNNDPTSTPNPSTTTSSSNPSSMVIDPPTSATGSNAGATPSGASSGGVASASSPTGKTNDNNNEGSNDTSTNASLSDKAVLEYLQKKGMGTAVLELKKLLGSSNDGDQSGDAAKEKKSLRDQLEEDDAVSRNQRTILTKSTGGGYGYDLDSAAPIVQWGVPDAPRFQQNNTTSSAAKPTTANNLADRMGVEEARALLDAFVAFQLWILSLPDHDNVQATKNPLRWAAETLKRKKIGATALVQQMANDNKNDSNSTNIDDYQQQMNDTFYNLPPSSKPELFAVAFALFVHTYCELLEVGMESTAHVIRDTFKCVYEPLYSIEFRDLFQCNTTEDIMRLNSHNSQHLEALANLKSILVQVAGYQLKREELIASAQSSNATSSSVRQQQILECDRSISAGQTRYSELSQRASIAFDKMHDLPFLRRARAVRWQLTMSMPTYYLLTNFLNSHDNSLLAMSTLLQTKCELHIEQRDPLPFTPACILEDNTYTDISADDAPGSTARTRRIAALELNKLPISWAAPAPRQELHGYIKGEELPFPKYHLDDEYDNEETAEKDKRNVEYNRALLIHGFRRLEALERKREYEVMSRGTGASNNSSIGAGTAGSKNKKIHFMVDPENKFKNVVANPLQPSILLSTLCSNVAGPVLRPLPPPSATNRNTFAAAGDNIASIWEESGIGLCCAKICPPDGRRVAVGCDDAAIRIWDLLDKSNQRSNGKNDGIIGSEPVQVLLGHKNGFPVFDLSWNHDGRSLLSAGGDGSIRLWDTLAVGPFGETKSIKQTSAPKKESTSSKKGGGGGGTSSDDPNKPGSTNLTASAAQQKVAAAQQEISSIEQDGMHVPGLKVEDSEYCCGTAVAVYRGHAPSKPIWSVSFAPCGYYFASAAADSTARLWTTDRPSPVRLFTGHTSSSVNCVNWHPNCNYVITGGEDKTVRLWDVQTGRTVRIFNGCRAGIHVVQISPCGQYAAGSDSIGVVHIWDMATGKKLTEIRTTFDHNRPGYPSSQQHQATSTGGTTAQGATSGTGSTIVNQYGGSRGVDNHNAGGSSAVNVIGGTSSSVTSSNIANNCMIHSLCFSSCGTALATGGDDCCVRIWDVRRGGNLLSSTQKQQTIPIKYFPTRQTLMMDLFYTKRNLLLSVGKYITPVPLSIPIND